MAGDLWSNLHFSEGSSIIVYRYACPQAKTCFDLTGCSLQVLTISSLFLVCVDAYFFFLSQLSSLITTSCS